MEIVGTMLTTEPMYLPTTKAVRETGIHPVDASLGGDPVATVTSAVEELLGQVDGSVAVITPTSYAVRLAPLAGLAHEGVQGRVQVVDPRLPPAWGALRLSLRYLGVPFRLHVERETTFIESDGLDLRRVDNHWEVVPR